MKIYADTHASIWVAHWINIYYVAKSGRYYKFLLHFFYN